ncbi:MAG: hypothetical protein ACAH88_12140 [Roseimicrobium sp.]
MSRRTKLIITALFLVLLGIPAAYVAITWHPANPLRFHLVEQKEIERMGVAGDGIFVITVMNTSNVPIRLGLAHLSWRRRSQTEGQDRGDIFPDFQERDHENDGHDYLFLPPQSSRICTVNVRYDDVTGPPSHETGVQATYHWCSSTKGRVLDSCDWLREHTPVILHPVIPKFHLDGDDTQIDPMLP